MASASTTEITAFESQQSDLYKSLQEPRNIESHVKVTIFLLSRPFECRPCVE